MSHKKKSKKRSFKFAVKRSKPSRKSVAKTFKKLALRKKPIKARDIGRAIRKARKSPGGIPRVDAVARFFTGGGPPSAQNSAAAKAQIRKREDELYRKLDGGTRDTRYVKARMPKIKSKSRSKKRNDRSRSSSSQASSGSYIESSVPEYQPFDFSQITSIYDQQIQDLNNRIAGMTSNFQNQAAQMQQQMAAERAQSARRLQEQQTSFDQRMQEQQNMFGQQMAAASPRDRIQGIRFADYGTGGATRAQLARQGTSGTFGRTGDRLMKISSLNV